MRAGTSGVALQGVRDTAERERRKRLGMSGELDGEDSDAGSDGEEGGSRKDDEDSAFDGVVTDESDDEDVAYGGSGPKKGESLAALCCTRPRLVRGRERRLQQRSWRPTAVRSQCSAWPGCVAQLRAAAREVAALGLAVA